MRSRMIVFAGGFAAALQQPQLLSIISCFIVLTILTVFSVVFLRRRLSLLYFFALGCLYVNAWGTYHLDQRLSESLKRTDWNIEGVVSELPRMQEGKARFILDVDSIESLDNPHVDVSVQRVSLSWYDPDLNVSLGDRIKLQARLKPPHGLVNPYGFDYERWLLSKGIDATGYVRGDVLIDVTERTWVNQIRLWINSTLEGQFDDMQVVALYQALTTGSKQFLNDSDWELLKHSGVIHLAVISGLHIGFMALCGWWLGRGFGALSYRYKYHYLFPYLGALLFAGFYLIISGLGVPAQRAFIMLAVLLITGSLMFYLDHWTRWWLAFVVVLLFNPLSFYSAGFWLSFGAVAVLLWLSQFSQGWRMALRMQFLLMIGMLPLYLFYFSGVSLLAPFFNLLAIPCFALIVPLLFVHLALSVIGVEVLVPVLEVVSQIFWAILEFNQTIQFGFLRLDPLTYISMFLVCVVGMYGLVIRLGLPVWIVILPLLPALLGVNGGDSEESHLKAWVYDVGQGLAVRVRVGQYNLIYDTGASYKSGGSALERAIIPHLEHQKINKIDRLILSHSDNDHAGGAKALIQSIDVDEVVTSYPYQGATSCDAGIKWKVGDVQFTFLAGGKGRTINDRSCVLLVETPVCSLLLPGDIGANKELSLISVIPKEIDWLVAAHHGSKFSTSSLFLDNVLPQNVIFSAGYANAFAHPHQSVVKRVHQFGANIFDTANDGAISLIADPQDGCKAIRMRQHEKRFWR